MTTPMMVIPTREPHDLPHDTPLVRVHEVVTLTSTIQIVEIDPIARITESVETDTMSMIVVII